jgi:hypothetical protein
MSIIEREKWNAFISTVVVLSRFGLGSTIAPEIASRDASASHAADDAAKLQAMALSEPKWEPDNCFRVWCRRMGMGPAAAAAWLQHSTRPQAFALAALTGFAIQSSTSIGGFLVGLEQPVGKTLTALLLVVTVVPALVLWRTGPPTTFTVWLVITLLIQLSSSFYLTMLPCATIGYLLSGLCVHANLHPRMCSQTCQAGSAAYVPMDQSQQH